MIVLAELGLYAVRLRFKILAANFGILDFHNRAAQLSNDRIVKLGLLDGFCDFSGTLACLANYTSNCRIGVRPYIDSHPGQTAIVRMLTLTLTLDVAAMIDTEKERFPEISLSICTACCRTKQLAKAQEFEPEHQIADYLHKVAC